MAKNIHDHWIDAPAAITRSISGSSKTNGKV